MLFAYGTSAVILAALVTVLFGSLFAGAVVAFWTQQWTGNRERQNRRDDLRLKLYLDVVDLVMDNELELAERGFEGKIPPREIQTKRIHIRHRLRLLGSPLVLDAYEKYKALVGRSIENPREHRPENPDDVVNAREQLIDAMAREFQEGRARQPSRSYHF